MDQMYASDSNPEDTGLYCVYILSPPVADQSRSIPDSRWWPLWHEYTITVDGIIKYGVQVENKPNHTPEAINYIAWADIVNLMTPSISLARPFKFQDANNNEQGRTPSLQNSGMT
jgi:hypothetical protein